MPSKENKQQRFILITILNIGLGMGGVFFYRLFHRKPEPIAPLSQIEASPIYPPAKQADPQADVPPITIPAENSEQPAHNQSSIFRLAHARWLIPLAILAIIVLHEYWTNMIVEPFGISDLWMSIVEVITLLLLTFVNIRIFKFTRWLRRHTILWGFLGVSGILIILMQREILLRTVPDVNGFYLAFSIWTYIFVLFYGASRDEFREMAHRLSKSPWTGLLISFITVILILISIEFLLRNVIFFTNSYTHGLIHRRWDQEYWNPLNELSFRDYPIGKDPGDSVIRTLVLGDSFAAGFGVQSIEETFPHLLQHDLGDDYHVYLVAHAGWNTDSQLRNLPTYPIEPDLIIHSYFLNDISYLSREELADWYLIDKAPPPPLDILVNNFYLGEFLYYNIYIQYMAGGDVSYNEGILDSYMNDRFWIPHSKDLEKLLDYAKSKDSDYIVLLWPSLPSVENSRQMTNKVANFYHEHDIPVINLAEDLRLCAARDLVVNPFDAHPNARTHHFAADRLYELMTTGKLEPITECPIK